jgi:predicted phage terminase large subunit-like protein
MKKMAIEQEYAALMRSDFHGFIERSFYELNPDTEFMNNWHLHVIAYELEQVRLGHIKRLIINVPPRSLKSHCATVAFPAFVLGHEPSSQIICASYAQDLSNKLAADCRMLMMSKMYKLIFTTRVTSQRPPLQEFATTRKGFRLATSVGGVLTGRGAEYLIVDDPLKPDEALSEVGRQKVNDWYDHTLLSRLNDKRNGRIIIIMQRLHENDLVGHVLDKEEWRVLRFPAIADEDESYTIRTRFGDEVTYHRHKGEVLHPEREDRETLDKTALIMGSYNFAGQYLQAPCPPGGGMIKGSWFKTYTLHDQPDTWNFVFQSWDTANKPTELSDYSVCTTWGVKKKDLYLLNVYRKRVDYPTLKRAVIDQAELWGATITLIEDKGSGTPLIQDLNYDGMYGIKGYELPPGQDKITRMHSASSMIENGFVYLPEKAEWLSEYLHELKVFPHGKHDDQVDSTSQALDWMKRRYLEPPPLTITTVYL